jgi:hypothetical protein
MIDKDELNKEYKKGLATFHKSLYQVIEVHAKARHIPFQGVAPFARLAITGSRSIPCGGIFLVNKEVRR